MKFPKIKSKALLAPMAMVNDIAFRAVCAEMGAGITYTPLLSSSAIARESKKTSKMMKRADEEKICAVQLFGSNIEELKKSALMVENHFDIIDLNCGCPAPKILKQEAGSALLNHPEKIGKIISALVGSVNKPITLKIRIGINQTKINALEVAKIAQDAGASAITIHGRTQKQKFSGKADWEIIKKIKEELTIPVFGNGDVTNPEIFAKRLDESKVDAIMIGRSAMGNPYLFRQINDYLKEESYKEMDKFKQFELYLEKVKKYEVESVCVKTQALYFLKGVPNTAKTKIQISRSKSIDEIKKILDNYEPLKKE